MDSNHGGANLRLVTAEVFKKEGLSSHSVTVLYSATTWCLKKKDIKNRS